MPLLTAYKYELKKLSQIRKIWIILSSLMFISIGVAAGEWSFIQQLTNNLQWIIIVGSGIACISWWYWTIYIIRRVIAYQYSIIDILTDITNDIQTVRTEISELNKP